MISHKELVKKLTQELIQDSNVLSLILYGSVSRNEESTNSDIDLLMIVNENHLQKRHIVQYGITIEFVEMHISYLQDFISKREIPMLFALADGIVLFNKIAATEQLIMESKRIIEDGPPQNSHWENESYRIKKRSDLTEIYKDLLDVDDLIKFNYIVSILLTTAIPMLIEMNNLWHQTRKKTMDYLKCNCCEGYNYIEILLKPECSLVEKRNAAKKLVEYTFCQYGGILEGEAVIFTKSKI